MSARANARVNVVIVDAGADAGPAAAALQAAGLSVRIFDRHAEAHAPLTIAPGCTADPLGRIPGADTRVLCVGDDGRSVVVDGAAPTDSLKRLSPRDAERWPEFTRRVAAIAGFLEKAYRSPVPGIDASSPRDILTALKLGRALRGLGKADMIEALRILPMSVSEWIGDWFETPALAGMLAARGVADTCLGPRGAGTAFVLLHHQVGRAHGVFALGGAPPTPRAESGRVSRILMRAGRATGVALETGETIDADAVLSGASPRRTFLELCDATQLAPELVRDVCNVRYRGVTAFVHLAVDALPAFGGIAADSLPSRIVIAPSEEYVERAYDDAKYGRVSQRPVLDIAITPGPKPVMTVRVQYAPYHLRDAGDGAGKAPGITAWNDASRDILAQHVIRTLAGYAPQLPGLVRGSVAITPRDLEERFGAPEGSLLHGEIALDQALFMRPIPSCAHHRTPVDGLYLCGPGVHPAGGIPGQAGSSAAAQILRDGRGRRSAP